MNSWLLTKFRTRFLVNMYWSWFDMYWAGWVLYSEAKMPCVPFYRKDKKNLRFNRKLMYHLRARAKFIVCRVYADYRSGNKIFEYWFSFPKIACYRAGLNKLEECSGEGVLRYSNIFSSISHERYEGIFEKLLSLFI